jgi:hypothetical protein
MKKTRPNVMVEKCIDRGRKGRSILDLPRLRYVVGMGGRGFALRRKLGSAGPLYCMGCSFRFTVKPPRPI